MCAIRSGPGGGSGFRFLEPDLVATARHVVAGHPPGREVRLAFPDGGRAARVLFEHPRVDLAVLQVLGERGTRAALQPSAPPPAGPLAVLIAAEDGLTAVEVEVPSHQRTVRQRDGHEEALIHFPAPEAPPLRSGSPVVTAGGDVVAVVTDGITLGGRRMIRATSIMGLSEWWTRRRTART
jgi:S1-C subfamily serine protease